jgi:hypothetical protein
MIDFRQLLWAMLSFGIIGCVSQETDHGVRLTRCDVTSIDAVFASPMTFHGRRFCGYGYYYEGSEVGGVYASPIANDQDRYEVAFLLDSHSRVGPEIRSAQNARVFVEGTIDAATCNHNQQPEDEGCTPVVHAIFLEEWTLR